MPANEAGADPVLTNVKGANETANREVLRYLSGEGSCDDKAKIDVRSTIVKGKPKHASEPASKNLKNAGASAKIERSSELNDDKSLCDLVLTEVPSTKIEAIREALD